jgi:hypothetical protein
MIVDPKDLLTQNEVLRRWPMLSRSELRRARAHRKAPVKAIFAEAFAGGSFHPPYPEMAA